MFARTLTLARLFLAAAVACALVLGAALVLFWRCSEQAALAAAQRSRQAVGRAVEARVAEALGSTERVLDAVERGIRSGLVKPEDPRGLEALLANELLGDERLFEVTWIGELQSSSGVPAPAPDARFQLSVFRSGEERIETLLTQAAPSGFVERLWPHARDGSESAPALDGVAERAVTDPTLQPTFVASVTAQRDGEPVWSDLHFSELGAGLGGAPSVVLTVQRALRHGDVLGVVRAGLSTAALDSIARQALAGAAVERHLVALLAVPASGQGRARLVTRVDASDPLVSIDDELRVLPRAPPPALAALLDSPLLLDLDAQWPQREAELEVNGEPWLATLSPLSIAGAGTRGWLVAVLVPRSEYTRELLALGTHLSLGFGASLSLVLAVLGGVLLACRRGLERASKRAASMRGFDFAPDPGRSRLAEIDELLESLERAKTVARAMGKYIPLPLVQSLFLRNREPELGGEPRDVTLLFSDIQGFTTLAERLAPDELAVRLGRYLEVVTSVLERHGATIDKYIGDAVMALWNVPAPRERHALDACRAVLACQRELAALYASPAWGDFPPLVTRFGVHRARVLVGHFGTPSRLAYTALGDGVNLAARLESECKRQGVTALVSGAVVSDAAELAFRPVDRVTVRGKSEPVDVYELLGEMSVAAAPGAEQASNRGAGAE